jgi:hypothetical protein
MKNTVVSVCFCLCSLVGFAQSSSLPPPSTDDGIVVQEYASSINNPNWASTALYDYRVASDNAFVAPMRPCSYDSYGRYWTLEGPSSEQLKAGGGSVRVIFLGAQNETSSIGYSYSGNPPGPNSYTVASLQGPSYLNALSFGDSFTVPLSIGDAQNFNLWYGTVNGFCRLLDRGAQSPSSPTGNVVWTSITVPTVMPDGQVVAVPTWIGNASWAERGAFHHYRFAVQLFYNSGNSL